MIAANLAFAFAIAVAVKVLFLFSGFAYWECLTAYAVCGAFSMMAFAWASLTEIPVRADQRS
ncbi:hypothetical protein E4191_22940 (plasmid) [Paracoccus liaowanqingii]|uniref:Uncharacterized protein n=1 Tax=Paracoccus liaowanqingii TaxID=2560053 RepID=A0A4Y5STR1_9RHOB|nr:hypothetical protein [Paracoccus liaowanqingii]QDA36907.1 hypothetical protein E4191_22940 [Paracoccus liaowanqingii]